MSKFLLSLLICFCAFGAYAQQTNWDLQRCVDYAMANNITVQQADVQARIAAIQTKQSRFQNIPTLGFNTNAGYQFGRSIDPTTNQYTNQKNIFSII